MKFNPITLTISIVLIGMYAISELFELTKTQAVIDKLMSK